MKEENQEGSSSAIASEGAARLGATRTDGLRLEIGKRYVDREGEIYGPMKATAKPNPYRKTHPFTDPDTGMSFTAEGFYYSAAQPNEMDLVAEAQDAVPGVPEAASAEGSPKGAYPCKTCGATGPEDKRWCFLCDSAFMTPEPSLGEGANALKLLETARDEFRNVAVRFKAPEYHDLAEAMDKGMRALQLSKAEAP